MMLKNSFSVFFLKGRWPAGYLLFFLLSCHLKTPEVQNTVLTAVDSTKMQQRINHALLRIAEIQKLAKPGDLITRTGNDFTSESLRILNRRNSTFSHCGIISIENDTVFVYHALGGEFNPDQRICRDPLWLFANPYENRGIGLFRFRLPEQQILPAIDTAKAWRNAGVTFDMDFDLKTNNKMYCAEFVAKAYTAGTNNVLKFNISHIKDFKFIGVDDIFMNLAADSITSAAYK